MKCSACKKKNADSYKRIVPGHELFETLQTMNPNRLYAANSYFCEECLLLAAENIKAQTLLMSIHNADTVNITTSSSQTSNERGRSNTVQPNKRSGNKENNPGPKRTKLADYRPGPASRKSKKTTSSVTTDKTSSQESVPEDALLLNVEHSTQNSQGSVSTTSSRRQSQPRSQNVSAQNPQPKPGPASRKSKKTTSSVTTDKTSSQESVPEDALLLNVEHSTQNSQGSVSTTSSRRKSQPRSQNVSAQNLNISTASTSGSENPQRRQSQPRIQNVSAQNLNISTASTSGSESPQNTQQNVLEGESSNHQSDDQLPIAAPSAPTVKDPRIRQANSRIADDLHSFFQQGGQGPALNVNNYSRSLAG